MLLIFDFILKFYVLSVKKQNIKEPSIWNISILNINKLAWDFNENMTKNWKDDDFDETPLKIN